MSARRVLLLLAVLTVMAPSRRAGAMPAFPGAVDVKQPDGRAISIRLEGDEYFHWNETADGYAIRQDAADGYWKYAKPSAKGADFESLAGARVGEADPVKLGLKPHALPERAKLRARMGEVARSLRPAPVSVPDEPITVGPPIPAEKSKQPSGRQSLAALSKGGSPTRSIGVAGTVTVRNIVILACFNDHWDTVNNTVLPAQGRVDVNEYNNLFNEVGHTSDGAVGSVRDYYKEVSYGRLTVVTTVVPWVHLPQNESYYGTDSQDINGNTILDTLWKEMISGAIDAADTAGFNFAPGDGDGNGWVDCLTVIHSGHAQEYTGNPATSIWSKQGQLNSAVTKDGVNMARVHTEPALRGDVNSPDIIRIGVICHELGHFFGLPDLYDYSPMTLGLGNWDIMAGGSWNGGDAKRPAHFGGWSKQFLGFSYAYQRHTENPVPILNLEEHSAVYTYRDGMSNDECFLVTNRQNIGFDQGSEIRPGIIIEHVYSPSSNNDLATWPHPVVKIEEADGNDSIGSKTHYSEYGDQWEAGTEPVAGFADQSASTTTNAMMYQSGGKYSRVDISGSYSYIHLNHFSLPAATMTFEARTLVPGMNFDQYPASPDYTVPWLPSTNATMYELQEGGQVIALSFTDGAEDADAFLDNWLVSGGVAPGTAGKRSGASSFAMVGHDGAFHPNNQSMVLINPFEITTNTVISFYYLSHVATGHGTLKCQITTDNGNTWQTLGSFSGSSSVWQLATFNATALSTVGATAGDICFLRIVKDVEDLFGQSAYPGYGYAIDDISVIGSKFTTASNWTTLSSSLVSPSLALTGRANGLHAYRVRAFANGAWQKYSDPYYALVDIPAPNAAKVWLGYR